MPDHLPLDVAATVPLAALTASQLVRWVDMPAGGSLLINGPSGAVGGFAVQLASQAGIEVIAVAKPEDADDLLALGASEVVGRGEFSHAVHHLATHRNARRIQAFQKSIPLRRSRPWRRGR